MKRETETRAPNGEKLNGAPPPNGQPIDMCGWSMRNRALWNGAKGFPVFRLKAGAHNKPLDKYSQDANVTTDPERIKKRWSKNSSNNIGIRTGDGLVVLDVDAQNGGVESILKQVEKHGPMPNTFAVTTPSGGAHYYFTTDKDIHNSAGTIGPGLDIRGYHGYVAAAGSERHPSDGKPGGVYAVVNDFPPAPMPEWLEKAALRDSGAASPANGRDLDAASPLEDVPAGIRNDRLYREACGLRGKGWNHKAILQALRARNDSFSEPLRDGEVESIARSAAKHEPNAPSLRDGAASAPVRVELAPFNPSDLLAPLEPELYLLPLLVPTESYTLIAGALSSFKTTLLHNLLLAKASGYDHLGLCDGFAIDPGPCVLLNYEDSDSRILRRFRMLVQHQRETLLTEKGSEAADQFMRRITKNLRRITLTGQCEAGIVRRDQGRVVPNDAFLDALLERIAEFADRGVLIALDPLRLAITGSQNDDDGADTVVHVFNRIATALPDSGLIATSHTTKAQAKDSGEGSRMDYAYATSGSALYSQHARSNFHVARLPSEMMNKSFDAGTFTPEDVAQQRAMRLTHGRLSYGAERGNRFFKMHRGLLFPVTRLVEPTTTEGMRARYLPVLQRVLSHYNECGIQPAKSTLEKDPDIVAGIGRNKVRELIALAEREGWIENVGGKKSAYRLPAAYAERQNSVAPTASGGMVAGSEQRAHD